MRTSCILVMNDLDTNDKHVKRSNSLAKISKILKGSPEWCNVVALTGLRYQEVMV